MHSAETSRRLEYVEQLDKAKLQMQSDVFKSGQIPNVHSVLSAKSKGITLMEQAYAGRRKK